MTREPWKCYLLQLETSVIAKASCLFTIKQDGHHPQPHERVVARKCGAVEDIERSPHYSQHTGIERRYLPATPASPRPARRTFSYCDQHKCECVLVQPPAAWPFPGPRRNPRSVRSSGLGVCFSWLQSNNDSTFIFTVNLLGAVPPSPNKPGQNLICS